MPDPFFIFSAPNGARRKKKDHPSIPITAEEIADCAEEVLNAGASMIHVHVRDQNQNHLLSATEYLKVRDAIKERIGDQLMIQITTEAVGIYAPEQQMQVVKDVKPESASIAVREICPDGEITNELRDFVSWMGGENVIPQWILYNDKDIDLLLKMFDQGLMIENQRPFLLFVLGHYSATRSNDPSIEKLKTYIEKVINHNPVWSVCGFGAVEQSLTSLCLDLGGHIRVGFENNIWNEMGEIVPSNAALVSKSASEVTKMSGLLGTADKLRRVIMC